MTRPRVLFEGAVLLCMGPRVLFEGVLFEGAIAPAYADLCHSRVLVRPGSRGNARVGRSGDLQQRVGQSSLGEYT